MTALEARGKNVWLDLDDIEPGADWQERIDTGIRAARAFAFVISPGSLESEYCRRELGVAVELGKPLVPIVRIDVPDDRVPDALAKIQRIQLGEADPVDLGIEQVVEAVNADLWWRDKHNELTIQAHDWVASGRDKSTLLRGGRLKEAEERWLNDPGPHGESPTDLQRDFVAASRRAASRRQQIVLGAVGFALAVSLALTAYSLVTRSQAIDREHTARSREIAALANQQLPLDPELSVLLAARAAETKPTAEAEDALRQAILSSHSRATFDGLPAPLFAADLAPQGDRAVTAAAEGTARLWSVRTGRLVAELRGHRGTVDAVKFDRRGERLLTAGSDGTVRIWDAHTGDPRAVLQGPTAALYGASFSDDGTRALAVSADGVVWVWNLTGGRPATALRGNGSVFNAAFDHGGTRVVAAGPDGATVWDARTGARLYVLRGHRGGVNRALFSPDGTRVVTAGDDGTARVWSAVTGASVAVLRGAGASVNYAAFDPEGARVVGASADRTARIWDSQSGRLLVTLRGHPDPVTRAVFSPDGAEVATTGEDPVARVWDTRTGRLLAELRGHTNGVGVPIFSSDGRLVLTSSDDGTARVWSLDSGQPARLGSHGREVSVVGFAADDRLALSRGADWTARLWDTNARTRVRTIGDPKRLPVLDAALSPDGGRVLTGAIGRAGVAAMISAVDAGGPVVSLRNPTGGKALSVAFSPDGRLAAGGGTDHVVRIWDATTGTLLHELRGHRREVDRVVFSPDGTRLASVARFDSTKIWNVASGRLLTTLPGQPGILRADAAFSPDGRLVVTTAPPATIAGPSAVRDAATGKPIFTLGDLTAEIVSVAFSPDGRFLLTASRGDPTRLWEIASGRAVLELRGESGETNVAAFSPDGRWIATGGRDGIALVWEAATGRLTARFEDRHGWVTSVAFGSDPRDLITGSRDGTVLLHTCQACGNLEQLLADVQAHVSVGRRLTAVERLRFLHER